MRNYKNVRRRKMMTKCKDIFKKSLLCLASALMIISGLTTNTFALTGTTRSQIYDSWQLTDNSGGTHGREGHLFVDDTEVYCVDFYTDFHRGKTVTAGTYKELGISEEKAKRLAVIAYYGHKVAGRTGNDWYAITQGLLWREIHETDDLYFVANPTAPDLATTKKYWNQILADVDRYYTAPSFAKTTQTVDSDGSITLTDTNGVLKDMVVASNGGLDVTISGNTLTIKGNTKTNTANIVLKKNVPASEMGTTIIYTASDCQSLGSFKISDPFQSSLKINVNQFGNLELTKYNSDQSATVPQTTYRITGPDDYDKTLTTDENGKIFIERLVPGDYKAVETKSANGYLINVTEKNFTIKANETTKIDFSNDEPTGQIELTKMIDTSKTNGLKGDPTLEGNVYGLYAKEKITNKASTKVFYEKDALVSSKTTDSDGNITWDDLPLGDYYIKEISSNDSLVLNDTVINVSLEYEGQTVSKVTVSKETSNRVNMQKIQVFKSGEKEGISGLVKGLQGCEFTFKLKSEVDHVGWDNAQTYAIITTDANGIANTPYLPYGQYLVKETKTPEDYITAPDFTVSVTDDYLEYEDVEQIKRININNRPFTSQVRLIKVDQESGETVTLNSASFKIKDSKGNYVIQKVSGIKQDTFTTNSKNQIVSAGGQKGEVILPLELNAGTYTIEEIKVPEGFLQLEEPVTFTITNQYNYDIDEDETPILTVKVKNSQPKGKILLTKTDKVTAQPLENVEYELTAKEDIYSEVDGTLRYRKGATVAAGKTNASGQIVIDELFMGKYELKEILTNEGYVLSSEVHDIVFEQKDTVTKEYVIEVDVTNIAPEGEIHLVKTDKDTGKLLSGVTFQLTAKEDIYSLDGRNTLIYKVGQTVSMDPGEDGLYVTDESGKINITGLALGHYELRELQTLEGYVPNTKVYDIDLTYDHSDKAIYTKEISVENEKTTTEISKIDATDGKELEGAHLSLKDKDGNIIEEWVSEKEPHIIRGLSVNQEYILHEDLAPIGYATASDVTFKVNSDGSTTKVTMKDEITKVDISKVDATTTKEIEGAKLTLTDKETGKVIESWTSGKAPHRIEGLEVGKTFILHEDIAPVGYEITSDIEFTILDTGEVQKIVMKDEHKPIVVKTGDNSQLELYVMAMGVAGIIAIVASRCIKKKESDDE